MSDIKTEGPRPLAFLLSEGNGAVSRETVTVASGEGRLSAGTVLGTVTASGAFCASPNAETVGKEGAETATAVLAYPVDATGADVTVMVIRRLAEVKAPHLLFHATVDDETKRAAKIAQLAAADIIAR